MQCRSNCTQRVYVQSSYNNLSKNTLQMDIVQAEAAFIQKMKSKNWSIKTIKNYASQVRIFLNNFKERDRARNITANEIEQWLLDKVNINSRKHCRCGINAFYTLVASRYWDGSTSRQQGKMAAKEMPYINKKHSLNLR